MKLQILSAVLSLCLCTSSLPVAQAWQEVSLPQKRGGAVDVASELVACDETIPTPTEAYNAMIALKEQDAYKEGTTWTDDEPYSGSNGYRWNGGPLGGANILATGCVAFSFILSDTAFGNLPARMYAPGEFEFSDIKVGDILRMNTDSHTVIVLEVSDAGVVVAEGNISINGSGGIVHWGRIISKEEVLRDTSHYITRYPEDYIAPDDPSANDTIADGTCGELTWNLTKAGTLTISGNGVIPDYESAEKQPWYANNSEIKKVIIEDGVTGIGSSAFFGCGLLSIEILSSVKTIGSNAFNGSSLISVNIPSSVESIGDSAFRACPNLSSVTFSEGLESINQNAFRGCTRLGYIELPASIGEVGAGAFMDCEEMTDADFMPGSKTVKLGDNIFTRCYKLMRVTLPTSIDRIGEGMFQNCHMLAGVEIPQGAESIGMQAFASSGVSVVIIPESVTSIGRAAFSVCPLEKIYFTGTEEQWKSIGRLVDTSNVTVHYGPLPTPTVSPDPTASPVPTQEPNPTASPAPTQNPGATASPAPTATPIPTEKPNPTTQPVPTEEPGPTGGPVTTEEPVPTEGPVPTEAPAPSGTPVPSEEPSPSGEPVPTEVPVPTQEPAPTTGPNPTQNPATTTEPNPTQEPQPTAKPVPPTEPTPEPVPTPDTGVPFIKGESGKEGWEAIKEDAVNAFEGKWVTVGMNGTSTVPGNVIESIKGMNVTLAFDMGNGLVWYVNGKNITADQPGDVNLSIQAGTSAIPQHIVEGVAGSRQATQLSLDHSGYFGYNAVLMINMGAANAGQYANLFYYNESTEKLEFVTFGRIDEYGATELTFSHASNYVIVVGEDVMGGSSDEDDDSDSEDSSGNGSDSKEAEVHSPKTGDDILVGGPNAAGLQQESGGMNLIGLLLVGAAVVSALGIITFLIYRKEDKED